MGKTLIIVGALIMSIGLIWHFFPNKFPLGNLPGDIKIESENSKIYIPITSSIIVCVILSLIAYFLK